MDNTEEKKSKLPSIEGYQIEGALSRTKSTVSFKATSELNRASVQITIATGEAYRTSLKPFFDESFPKISKALKLVDHPHVISLLDAGYAQEMPFTVTPYYAAGSLKQFMGNPRDWRDVFSILLPIADGLAYCQDHGIIHRDVKPQNIVINDQGDLCLTNFSLLEPTAANKLSVTLTGSGECFPAYVAPEVWHGKCSPAVDQYNFGVMLYELLTATLPFDASNVVSLLVQQATETIAAPSTLVSGIPKTVDSLIERLLASDSAARLGSMRDLKNAMQDLLNNSNLLRPGETQQASTTPKLQENPCRSSRQSIPPVSTKVVQPEQPGNESAALDQEKLSEEKSAQVNPPKKKSNLLVIFMFGILVAVILCAAIFLVGLLTDMGFISRIPDRLSNWLNSGPLKASIDGNDAPSMSTSIPLEENETLPAITPTLALNATEQNVLQTSITPSSDVNEKFADYYAVIYDLGKGHAWSPSDPWALDQQMDVWIRLEDALDYEIIKIIDAVYTNYADSSEEYLGISPEEVNDYWGLRVALGMRLWGFAQVDTTTKVMTTINSSRSWNLTFEYPSEADFAEELLSTYNNDYRAAFPYESQDGTDVYHEVEQDFISYWASMPENYEKYAVLYTSIYDSGKDHDWTPSDPWTIDQQNDVWNRLEAALAIEVDKIVDYVVNNYAEAYAKEWIGFSPEEITSNASLQVAFGMRLWGFAETNTTTKLMTAIYSDRTWDLTYEYPTQADYADEILLCYKNDYRAAFPYESPDGTDVYKEAKENFVFYWAPLDPDLVGSVPNISGNRKLSGSTFTTEIEVIKTALNYLFDFPVTPPHSYGSMAKNDNTENLFSVDFGHLSLHRNKDDTPMGDDPASKASLWVSPQSGDPVCWESVSVYCSVGPIYAQALARFQRVAVALQAKLGFFEKAGLTVSERMVVLVPVYSKSDNELLFSI